MIIFFDKKKNLIIITSEDFISLKQNLMKFPKVMVFGITTMVVLCGLCPIFLGTRVFAAKRPFLIKGVLSNAVEHIGAVRFIWNDTDDIVEISSELWKYNLYIKNIEGNSNFLLASSEWNNNIIDATSSNILGWKENVISSNSSTSTIIAWEWNKIGEDNKSSVIWWGKNNKINNGASASVIVWWSNNIIGSNSANSTIVWWSNNTVVWNSSIVAWNNNTVRSNNSVALWTKSNIEWSNSFLWNDGARGNNEVLEDSNVFAIISNNWLVVNAEKAAKWAQLTVWWSLIVKESMKNNQISCWWWQWKWSIKLEKFGIDDEEVECESTRMRCFVEGSSPVQGNILRCSADDNDVSCHFMSLPGNARGDNTNVVFKDSVVKCDSDENIQCHSVSSSNSVIRGGAVELYTTKDSTTKAVIVEGKKHCLCGCDGYSWNSLYWEWTCEKVCNPRYKPICSEDKVSKQMVGWKYYYDVKCEEWQVVEWSILVSSDEKIHWSCQVSNGEVKQCESEII